MSFKFDFDFNPNRITRALEKLGGGIAAGSTGPLRDSFYRSAVRYLAFIRRRFQRLSRSNGTAEWPALADITKLYRLSKTKAGAGKVDRVARSIETGSSKLPRGATQASEAARNVFDVRRRFERTGSRATVGRIVGTFELSGSTFEILRDTGILFNSLTIGDANNKIAFEPLSITVSSAVRYAAYHQDPPVPGRPPKREIFVLPDPETRAQIVSELDRGVARIVRDAEREVKS